MMFILSVFLITGCSSSDDENEHGLPNVVAVSPQNNSFGVSMNTKTITASFSEEMDPATLTTASFMLECPAGTPVTGGGTVTLAAGNVATFSIPTATRLPPCELCTATITTGAKDLDGKALAGNFIWTFYTSAIAVTAVVPLNNAVGVAINTKKITAAFNEEMDPSTLTTASFKLECPTGTPVTGGGPVTYLIEGSVATLPLPVSTNLPENTLCTATITNEVTAVFGYPLPHFVWSFRTGITPDTTRPSVIHTLPVTTNPGPTTGVPTNTAITAVFSEDMIPATITAPGTFTLTGPGTTPVEGVSVPVTYAVGSRTAIFWPAAALAPGTTYTATITTAATDLADNALSGNQADLPAASYYEWAFTTAVTPVPTANVSVSSSSVNPAAGAHTVCPSATVSATFIVPSGLRMDPLTVNTGSTFILMGPDMAVVYGTVGLDAATGRVATFTPINPLPVGTYTFTIKGGASGVSDLAIPKNKMVNDFTWTFTVVPTGSCVAP
jgi:hypothetical protein